MPRSTTVMLLGLLGTSLASTPPPYDQEKQHRDADCDNGCFFGSFPGGSCTNDPACMCTHQKYRERYFCCMADKCDRSVLIDSIQRQSLGCESWNNPFTFDAEAVCGIKLYESPTQSVATVTQQVTVTVTHEAKTTSAFAASASASAAATSRGSAVASGSETTGAASSTSAPAPSTVANGAPIGRVRVGIVLVATAFAMLL
ncbi:uncharacterized protein CTRU02_204249 [Colletotrichum truncatum]|uniref:Uncharacterized protein n=1 Tax=Colletotrichum truncatum TaxID=5467 RepID=A0ACC3ZBK8_COLTU|nr:uncharacterized protein CTRU02_10100 [Colletotrichum truncatum]KAF6787805.1 hypothetical protein CTRU02_10100 [Colletotrichum truncatum]